MWKCLAKYRKHNRCSIKTLAMFGFDWLHLSLSLLLFPLWYEWLRIGFFKGFYLFIFRKKGREGKEKERERKICKRNVDWLSLTHPQLGTWPATQACAPTRNETCDLPVCRPEPNPLSHTSQGGTIFYLFIYFLIKKNFWECLLIFRALLSKNGLLISKAISWYYNSLLLYIQIRKSSFVELI